MANKLRVAIAIGIIVAGVIIGCRAHKGMRNITEKRNAQIERMLGV